MPADSITLHNVYDEEPRYDRECKPFIFPGGEPHVLLKAEDITDQYVWFDARLGTAEGFLKLLACLSAASNLRPKRLGVFLPYFPGARQDRHTTPGSPCTLQIYIEALCGVTPDCLVVVDPHSQELVKGYRRCAWPSKFVEITPTQLIPFHDNVWDAVIAPDLGGQTRAGLVATEAKIPVVYCGKKRDSRSGQLSGFEVPDGYFLANRRYLIVDDICDGGGTFVGLADEIMKRQPECTLDLWVSHGIFSKGFSQLQRHFTRIITTDSFPQSTTKNSWGQDLVQVIPLHSTAAAVMRRTIAT